MGGEGHRCSKRQSRRLRAWWSIHYGQGRGLEPLTAQEAAECVSAIESNRVSYFGVEKLSRWDMSARVAVAAWIKGGAQPILKYAATRGRHGIVEALLKSRLEPLSSDPEAWSLLSKGEAEAIEAKLLDGGPRRAACLLVAAGRMMEAASRRGRREGAYAWAWVASSGKRQVFKGCHCEIEAAKCWAALLMERYACPSCGTREMPSPVMETAPRKTATKRRSAFDLYFKKHSSRLAEVLAERGPEVVDERDDVGASLALYAAIARDRRLLDVLAANGADLDQATPLYPSPRRVYEARTSLLLQMRREKHSLAAATTTTTARREVASEAFVVDQAAPAELLERLQVLFELSPTSGGCSGRRDRDDMIERRHFLDATGELDRAFSEALGEPVCVAPRAKFLDYKSAEAHMAPHIDLAKRVAWLGDDVRPSTSHTWILYLTTLEGDNTGAAGATLLLDTLSDDPNSVKAAVSPRPSRLFVFPHRAPHAARPISPGGAKRIARGELFFWRHHWRLVQAPAAGGSADDDDGARAAGAAALER